VLNNLVDNAIKYHRHNQRGKYIAVNGKSLGKTYKIEVSDNGQGIPDQAQSKIFDMFFRASDNSIGSGLGLFIVKDMVERIGGSIRLDSKLGEGTTFTIELPKE
jgi:signal transduction histidine kinase